MCHSPSVSSTDNRHPATKFSGILRASGVTLNSETKVLDFGCGAGGLVRDLVARGIDAYGCDFTVPQDAGSLSSRLRAIDPSAYGVPYEADMFDVVISNQVFEHVQDYSTAVSEIARVLKPNGVTLHIFPACFRPIEPHVLVPLATRIRAQWWLRLWAALGVRNAFQRGLTFEDVALRNRRYLTEETKYLSRRQIREEFASSFTHVNFCDRQFVKHLRKSWLGRLDNVTLGLLARSISGLHTRAVFAAGPLKTGAR